MENNLYEKCSIWNSGMRSLVWSLCSMNKGYFSIKISTHRLVLGISKTNISFHIKRIKSVNHTENTTFLIILISMKLHYSFSTDA